MSRLAANFSTAAIGIRRQRKHTFKVPTEHDFQLITVYPAKLCQNESGISMFSDKEEHFMTKNPPKIFFEGCISGRRKV